MSHIVTIQTEVRDAEALGLACRRLELGEPVHETVPLFSGEVSGYAVRLPDWRYPVVFDIEQGQVRYDNFEGRWGEPTHLNRLLQSYGVEKCRLEARRKGHSVLENQLSDGSIKLTIQIGEGHANH